MLIRPFAAYVAGVATIAFAHSAGSGTPGRLGFALGVLSTLLVAAWALASRNRALKAANLILRIVGTPVNKVQPAAKSEVPKNRVFAQVVTGLKGLGMDKDEAQFAAGQATSRLPGGSLDETFKLALQVATHRS